MNEKAQPGVGLADCLRPRCSFPRDCRWCSARRYGGADQARAEADIAQSRASFYPSSELQLPVNVALHGLTNAGAGLPERKATPDVHRRTGPTKGCTSAERPQLEGTIAPASRWPPVIPLLGGSPRCMRADRGPSSGDHVRPMPGRALSTVTRCPSARPATFLPRLHRLPERFLDDPELRHRLDDPGLRRVEARHAVDRSWGPSRSAAGSR
jgi:hypothetical protein